MSEKVVDPLGVTEHSGPDVSAIGRRNDERSTTLDSAEEGIRAGARSLRGYQCFAFARAASSRRDQCGEDATDEAIALMHKNHEQAWTWTDIRCGDDGENVIMFSSGDGDACYASYWGLDEAGAPAWLVTDFRLFEVAWGEQSP